MTITSFKLRFSEYKTKIKQCIRRKWKTLWDMFPNNKLYGHQLSIKLETGEPLPNRRQDIILSRIRIGHTYQTHAYMLKGETGPPSVPAAISYSQSIIYWLTVNNM